MKKSTFKKVFALMLAFVLVFAMSVPAFAATPGQGYTITITPGTYTDTSKADRYKAYEIFKGKLTEATEDNNNDDTVDETDLTDYEMNQLANIKWGDDIDVSKLVNELTKNENAFDNAFAGISSFSGDAQAAEVARILSEKGNPPAEDPTADQIAAAEAFAKAFAIAAQNSLKSDAKPVSSTFGNGKFSILVGQPGYYLITDEPGNDPTAPKKGDIISEHILQVVRDRDVKVKSDTPTVDKEIVTGFGGYDIGETITFRLTGTIAENFRNFTGKYYYAFKDTMSKGLTLDEDSIAVEIWTVKAKDSDPDATKVSTLTKGTDYTVEVGGTDSTELTVAFEDLKNIAALKAEHVIVVTYNACINEDAVIGAEINKVYLEFSNNPYTENSKTETPEKKLAVETFEIDVIKTDSVSGKELEGVNFILYYVDPGNDLEATEDDVTYYGVFNTEEAEEGNYTLLEKNGWILNKDTATSLVTVENGVLNIKGLGEGTYYLEEAAYNGYNTLSGPIEINISATYYEATDAEVIAGTKVAGEVKTVITNVTIDGKTSTLAEIDTTRATATDANPAVIPINVKNVPASSLPGTGGIGNYIFYIGGVLLIAAAVALLIVSKKRTSKEVE